MESRSHQIIIECHTIYIEAEIFTFSIVNRHPCYFINIVYGRYDKYNHPLVPYQAYPYWRYTCFIIHFYLVSVSFSVSLKVISIMKTLIKNYVQLFNILVAHIKTYPSIN